MISIITPIYNSAKTLPTYFESLSNQTFQDFEVLLIDDGSTDNSLKICKKYAGKDNRLKIFKKSHSGASATRNYGLEKAAGEYIYLLDSDDTISPILLETLLKNAEKNHADLSCCGFQEITNGKITCTMNREKNKQNPYLELLKNYKGFFANKLYKRDIIIKNNLKLKTDISMCEDLLFNFEYLNHCKKIVCSDKNLYNYHNYPTSLSHGFKKSWFDILKVYNILQKDLARYSHPTQDYLGYNYLIAISEAKMRANIMNLDFAEIQQKYGLKDTALLYQKLKKSPYLTPKEKFRLFLFVKHNDLASTIKFGRHHA